MFNYRKIRKEEQTLCCEKSQNKKIAKRRYPKKNFYNILTLALQIHLKAHIFGTKFDKTYVSNLRDLYSYGYRYFIHSNMRYIYT